MGDAPKAEPDDALTFEPTETSDRRLLAKFQQLWLHRLVSA